MPISSDPVPVLSILESVSVIITSYTQDYALYNVSGMGDDVPILGAVVTLLKADGLLLSLMMFLYISMVRSLYIIIVFGIWDNFWGRFLRRWSSAQYVQLVVWSSGQYGHLVNIVI